MDIEKKRGYLLKLVALVTCILVSALVRYYFFHWPKGFWESMSSTSTGWVENFVFTVILFTFIMINFHINDITTKQIRERKEKQKEAYSSAI
jgi:TRAP-type C4-dicarboxylate transport system permease small subunit